MESTKLDRFSAVNSQEIYTNLRKEKQLPPSILSTNYTIEVSDLTKMSLNSSIQLWINQALFDSLL